MRHEKYPLRPVVIGHRCVGHVIETFKGHVAYDSRDKAIGVYPDAERAVRQLHIMAGEPST
jgi:hypothetical protein